MIRQGIKNEKRGKIKELTQARQSGEGESPLPFFALF